MTSKPHSDRKHSKFSASGSERWFECPGSVELSEGLPDKSSIYAKEGTDAHEVLEATLLALADFNPETEEALHQARKGRPKEMIDYAQHAADFIWTLWREHPGSELMVETRIPAPLIHEDAFGTFDAAVVDHFGTLHVFDYKYGAGVPVAPGSLRDPNLQMCFYGIAVADFFKWNFKRVRLWIIQPRVKGYDGPMFLDLTLGELRALVPRFQEAVARVLGEPTTYVEGGWCHWCKAKSICPLKKEAKNAELGNVFGPAPVSEAEWRKAAKREKKEKKLARAIGDFF